MAVTRQGHTQGSSNEPCSSGHDDLHAAILSHVTHFQNDGILVRSRHALSMPRNDQVIRKWHLLRLSVG